VGRACRVFSGPVALVVLGVVSVPSVPAADPNRELRIGLPAPMFKDVPEAMVNAAAKPLQKMIQEKSGLTGRIEIFPDYLELANSIKTGKTDIGVFHGFEYAWVKDTPGLVPLVVTRPNCGKVQACLVVGPNSKAKSAEDLKGACVAVPQGCKAHCMMFLERLRERLPEGVCCPGKPQGLTPEETLNAVLADTCQAALVDVASLIAYQKQYPGLGQQLRVLEQSTELPSAVVVYRRGALDEVTIGRIRRGLLECVSTPIGKTFAMFWQLNGFEDVTPAYLTLVNRCLEAYPAPLAKGNSGP